MKQCQHISQQNIAPRVFYADYEKLYYVMEKMDMTLEGIFREHVHGLTGKQNDRSFGAVISKIIFIWILLQKT